jgi:S-methylmethionine-dependent homocysteine/selenocysteine methylase
MTEITLLDGGMGQELVHRAGDRPTPLWSTQIMIDHPGLVAEVHTDFFVAGATIATTNSYAIHLDRLKRTEMEGKFNDLHTMAMAEAQTAKTAHGSGRIAGSIGPLGASYRPDLHSESDVAVPHARDMLAALLPFGKPVWLAVTVQDTDGTRLRSGEPLSDIIPIVQKGAAAVLINCCTPEVIPAGLDILKDAGLPFGAYANGFEKISEGFLQDAPTVDALSQRRDFTPALYADHVMNWVGQGATLVGGCCEVSPAHIAEIANRLRVGGHQIV